MRTLYRAMGSPGENDFIGRKGTVEVGVIEKTIFRDNKVTCKGPLLGDMLRHRWYILRGTSDANSSGKTRTDTPERMMAFMLYYYVGPGLIIKTSAGNYSIMDRDSILDKIRQIEESVDGDLPSIYLLHGELSDEEINELYNHPKVKAHVSFTKGEGYGYWPDPARTSSRGGAT